MKWFAQSNRSLTMLGFLGWVDLSPISFAAYRRPPKLKIVKRRNERFARRRRQEKGWFAKKPKGW